MFFENLWRSDFVVPLQRQKQRVVFDRLLGYGVMVTQQILVLFFLVRIRVAQQRKGDMRLAYFPFFVAIRESSCRDGIFGSPDKPKGDLGIKFCAPEKKESDVRHSP